jgi:hypothetical protein
VPEIDSAMLSWLIDCPPEVLEFTRVGPIEIAHGGQWAKHRHLDSFRWPFLDQPVIHGKAVGLRMGVRWPGEAPEQEPLAMRALTEWEGRNALRWFEAEKLPLSRLHCPVEEKFLASLGFPLHAEFRAADAAGRLAIRQRVMAERKAAMEAVKPAVEAELAESLKREPLGSWLAQRQARQQELSRR